MPVSISAISVMADNSAPGSEVTNSIERAENPVFKIGNDGGNDGKDLFITACQAVYKIHLRSAGPLAGTHSN